jgi:gamma-glutamyl-gamma-aminobutyraldehyde dehydrogenase
MVRGIRAGVVHVNTYGGVRCHGAAWAASSNRATAHDKSLHALEKYTDLKTAWIQLWHLSSNIQL